jgi:hypothetical protein
VRLKELLPFDVAVVRLEHGSAAARISNNTAKHFMLQWRLGRQPLAAQVSEIQID